MRASGYGSRLHGRLLIWSIQRCTIKIIMCYVSILWCFEPREELTFDLLLSVTDHKSFATYGASGTLSRELNL